MDDVLCLPGKAHRASDSVIIHIKAILAPCLIHFVICVTGTTALGSLFGGARPLLIGLMADK